ncbi:hypothetical protein SPBR_05867 [Sporothrix brasiliensis 5110]|uniref:3-beta hydroxysteroid dehydrogenase/isomerase domain-containing protein n=1 Tax=Sporothrix brasiliensis 5110 TaxID=1398154 RepID=A0A0C2F566_9PEZI|nr:uncharacterized protein SPBR_05867 [Sporothrix brasiliensis 5110]KIH94059.1 hypothetical protein SPBR_05867 [Sporothrix brasiliensis 5110]
MDGLLRGLVQRPLLGGAAIVVIGLVLYLALVNRRMRGVPDDAMKVKQPSWTAQVLHETYARLEENPINVETTKAGLPPKLERRYIVTGGCGTCSQNSTVVFGNLADNNNEGLVGGYLVLQLLARGQPPESIRIVDFQGMHRRDMLDGPARHVEVIHTDVSSPASTDAAFGKPWPKSVAKLPLTVFHTAAVIVPSDRTQSAYRFLERINIEGTKNVLASSRRAGADVLVYTASASIAIRFVEFFLAPWRLLTGWPKHFVQQLNEDDFFHPLRPFSQFFSAYAASKAAAERIVCDANCETLRTGSIRPANGIYGHPTDNTVGQPLNGSVQPTWSFNIVNSFLHGMNCAVAHLNFEAVLADPRSSTMPQAGRPFSVTDPNGPIQFQDLWFAIEKLSITPFRTIALLPVQMLLMSYAVEAYIKLPQRFPVLKTILPALTGDIKHLQPALFSVVTHLYATNDPVSKSVKEGGLGYRGLITTLDGVVQQLLDWNLEHKGVDRSAWVRYRSSVSMAEDLNKIGATAKTLQK